MATCYSLVNTTGLFSVRGQQKCGPSTSGAQFCCNDDDTCLENSICHYTHSSIGGSGYYIGGCTDPSFPEPCSKSCTDLTSQDIVFTDTSTSLWACCYQYLGASLNCSNPGNETFYAPSPQSLTRQAAPSSTTSSSATSSTRSSITPSSTPSASASAFTATSSTSSPTPSASISTPSATPTHAPSSSLSTGGKAGIGLAASIVGLGIIILLGFFLHRKRRPQRYQETRVNGSNELASSPILEQRNVLEKSAEQQWELDGNGRSEMDGSGRSEMEARRGV